MPNQQPHGLNDAELANVANYCMEHMRIESLSNEALARELLAASPLFGRLGELCDVAAERLAPGIIDRMAAEEGTTP